MATLRTTIFIDMCKRDSLISSIIIVYELAYVYIPFVKLGGGYPNITYGEPFMGMGCNSLMLIFSISGELLINKQY